MAYIPEFLKNVGEHCWDGCNKQQGKCDWCGTNGWCCRKGVTGNGCDGTFGGQTQSQCVSNPGMPLNISSLFDYFLFKFMLF